MTNADVSVAISLYNYQEYIQESIESVCAQSIAHRIELLIVDDASTDNSIEVVRNIQDHRPDLIGRLGAFRLIQHAENLGLAEARNTAFRMATTAAVLVLDADNLLLPDAVCFLSAALQHAPDSVGAAYPLLAVHGHRRQSIANELQWDPSLFRNGNYIDALALIRKSSWNYVGGFRHTPGGWEDYDFWCRFVENDLTAIQVPQLLAIYSHHNDSMKNSETALREAELSQLMQQRHPWLGLI